MQTFKFRDTYMYNVTAQSRLSLKDGEALSNYLSSLHRSIRTAHPPFPTPREIVVKEQTNHTDEGTRIDIAE